MKYEYEKLEGVIFDQVFSAVYRKQDLWVCTSDNKYEKLMVESNDHEVYLVDESGRKHDCTSVDRIYTRKEVDWTEGLPEYFLVTKIETGIAYRARLDEKGYAIRVEGSGWYDIGNISLSFRPATHKDIEPLILG